MKRCTKCNETDPAAFSKDARLKSGLRATCKRCDRESNATWQKKNPEKVRSNNLKFYNLNKEAINIARLQRNKNRYRNDPAFRAKCIIAALIRQSLKRKGFHKKAKTLEIVGLGNEDLHRHLLEGFFKVYNRYPSESDQLDIDHITPLATAKTEEEVLKLNHYTNLRYLIRKHNQKEKRAKLDWSIGESL